MANEDQKKLCVFCGGSGQLSFFKGVSRFLLSTEECSECAGSGYQLDSGSGEVKNEKAGKTKTKGSKKKQ
jgi:hypothetical protein